MEYIGINSRSGRAGAQSGDQWTQPRRSGTRACGVQEEPQVCDQPWFTDVDDRQQDQVKCDYMRQPRSASSPKDRGMQQTTQVKCEYIRQPRSASTLKDRGVDDLLQEARQLCTLFREQELVTHQINFSMTNMCMQLVADTS